MFGAFQDDFGVENGGQNGGKIGAKPRGAFRDAPGARLPGDAVWGCILEVFWDPPNPENRASATMRAQFRLNTLTAPGGPKSTPFWSKIEAKSLPGAERCLQYGCDFNANFDPRWYENEGRAWNVEGGIHFLS